MIWLSGSQLDQLQVLPFDTHISDTPKISQTINHDRNCHRVNLEADKNKAALVQLCLTFGDSDTLIGTIDFKVLCIL